MALTTLTLLYKHHHHQSPELFHCRYPGSNNSLLGLKRGACPIYWRMFSSIPGLHPLDASGIPPLVSHDNQKCPSVSSFQWLSCVRLFATPWTAARQASLSITNSRSLLKLMSIELVMPSSHLIVCHPLLLLPSLFPSIRVFSNESSLCIRWPKYWSFSFSISPSNEHPGLISFRMDWLDLLAV